MRGGIMRGWALGWALLGLLGCDSAGPHVDPAPEVDPAPPTTQDGLMCGSLLAQPGMRAVAQYDDAYVIKANTDVVLLETAKGDLRWLHLRTQETGPLTISGDFMDPTVRLFGPDQVLISGYDYNFKEVVEVRRLADDTMARRVIDARIRGGWAHEMAEQRLVRLSDGTTWPFDCQTCVLTAVDGADRAWFRDYEADDIVALDLTTGQPLPIDTETATRVRAMGAGAVVRFREREVYWPASGEPVACEGNIRIVTPAEKIFCEGQGGVQILDRFGAQERFLEVFNIWGRPQVFGDTVIAGYIDRSTPGDKLMRIPLDPAEAIERIDGRIWQSFESLIVVYDSSVSEKKLIGLEGLRDVQIYGQITKASADGRRGVVQSPDDATRSLVDLETGRILAAIPDGGWLRFVGSTLLHDGAPLGEPAMPGLSNIIFPDAACPAAIMEHCTGQSCTLSVLNASE